MNWDRIEGNWKQFKGIAKQQWGKLTDDQLDVIAGKRDHLSGKIQETYGITRGSNREADFRVAEPPERDGPPQVTQGRGRHSSARQYRIFNATPKETQ